MNEGERASAFDDSQFKHVAVGLSCFRVVGGALAVKRSGETNTGLVRVHQVTVVSGSDTMIAQTRRLPYSTQGGIPETERTR